MATKSLLYLLTFMELCSQWKLELVIVYIPNIVFFHLFLRMMDNAVNAGGAGRKKAFGEKAIFRAISSKSQFC